VLKPKGRFLFNVWDQIEDNDFARVVTDVACAMFPDDPPRFLARTPHGYHKVEEIEAHLREAGFSGIEIVTLQKRSVAPGPRDAAVAYVQGSPLRSEIETRDPEALDKVTDRATQKLAEIFGDGPVSGKIQAHVVVAHRL